MKLATLFSGGKDSGLALYKASKEQGNEISCLISIFSKNPESYMFHVPNIKLTKIQAKAMQIPIIIQKTKGEKEEELKDLKKAIKKAKNKFKIEGIVTGALASNYQKSRIEKICEELKLKCMSPLWQENQFEILNDLIKNNFEVMVVGIFAYPFSEEWLGKIIDEKTIDELRELTKKFKINPAGEGGEIETFILDCPLFKKKIKIEKFEKDYKNYSGSLKIKKARLVGKN